MSGERLELGGIAWELGWRGSIEERGDAFLEVVLLLLLGLVLVRGFLDRPRLPLHPSAIAEKMKRTITSYGCRDNLLLLGPVLFALVKEGAHGRPLCHTGLAFLRSQD